MSEKLKYVSPEYQAQLDELAERLVTPERFGELVIGQLVLFEHSSDLEDTVEFPAIQE